MARKNAEQLAEEARERLRISSEKQQEIALQAIQSIENGADPKLAIMIAEEAAKSVSSRSAVQLSDQSNQRSLEILPEEKITHHIRWIPDEIPAYSDASSIEYLIIERHPNREIMSFVVRNHEPIALPKYAVDYMVEKYPDHFARVEEN
jgi:single-stranded DNA-specific DHH superfamily exonuclease